MIGRIEAFLRHLRRSLSRSVWLSRLLRLPVSSGSPNRPGLLLIQIDGLSQPQCARAMARKELPFLRQLIAREGYRLQAHYSGLPSTTPAVQAELFYGVKGAVPAFSFRDHQSRGIVRMFEPGTSASLEEQLTAKTGEALLTDGSAYSDIYTGGAPESHFCPSVMGWGPALRGANPLVLLAFVITNLFSFLRIAVLFLMEVALALVGVVRGCVSGQALAMEMKFVPARLGVTILLRELIEIGCKIDLSRGLPIIHVNFLGYDEQSHRRGPQSRFAHWSLKGIDSTIARLWGAANQSAWRRYEVWIYSDHGQTAVRPYRQVLGYTLEEAVVAVFTGQSVKDAAAALKGQSQPVPAVRGQDTLGLVPMVAVTPLADSQSAAAAAAKAALPVVVAPGPVGHVYSPRPLSHAERDGVARALVYDHRVPVVLAMEAPGRLCAWTDAGSFQLPRDRVALFGAQHPFLDQIGDDLVRLCEHPDAGDLVVLGWREGLTALSFSEENGAHAGAHPDETNGFALLPTDTTLPQRDYSYLRPMDLRDAALHYLGRPPKRTYEAHSRATGKATDTLRVMTYNVHGCTGMDGRHNVERIARMIARANPDVVALQELDVGRPRSQGINQVQLIARHLEMEFQFHPAFSVDDERYGDAILSHLPLRLVKAGALPGLSNHPHLEPRGAVWVAIDLHGTEIQIINTHLGLHHRERLAQVATLLGSDWLASNQCRDPVILCGDFNARPSSAVCRRLGQRLKDAQTVATDHRPQSTFTGRFPLFRIDHIFLSPGLTVSSIEVPSSELARVASDHLPLIAEVRLAKPKPQ